VKRIYREEKVKLRPKNGDHEELVLPAEDVRVQGCGLRGTRSRGRGSGGWDVKVGSC
jgi:hypothetical protein